MIINNSKLRNCVIVAIECFFATIDRCSMMTGMDRRSMINLAHRLNLSGPSLTVVSIGMEHLSLVTLLLMYLNRLTKRNRYFGGCNI